MLKNVSKVADEREPSGPVQVKGPEGLHLPLTFSIGGKPAFQAFVLKARVLGDKPPASVGGRREFFAALFSESAGPLVVVEHLAAICAEWTQQRTSQITGARFHQRRVHVGVR